MIISHNIMEFEGAKVEYPLAQGTFRVVVGQYDPAEQKTSLLLLISAQTFAPPQVWFVLPGGS